jgi:hypothetical protein
MHVDSSVESEDEASFEAPIDERAEEDMVLLAEDLLAGSGVDSSDEGEASDIEDEEGNDSEAGQDMETD